MKKVFEIIILFALIIISSAKSHSGTLVDEAIKLATQQRIEYGATYMNWNQYVSLAESGVAPKKLVCNEFVSLVLAKACNFSSPPSSTTITGLSNFLRMTYTKKSEELIPGDILFLVRDSEQCSDVTPNYCHDAPCRNYLIDGRDDHVGVVVQVSNFGSGVGGVFLAESGRKLRSCLSVLQEDLTSSKEDLTSSNSWKQQTGGRITFYPYYYINRFMVGYARPSETDCTKSVVVVPQSSNNLIIK